MENPPHHLSISRSSLFTNGQGHLHLLGLGKRVTSTFGTASLKSLCWSSTKGNMLAFLYMWKLAKLRGKKMHSFPEKEVNMKHV